MDGFKLNNDGLADLTTVRASPGGLIRDHEGRLVGSFRREMKGDSSIMAEFWAHKDGLQLAYTENIKKN